MTYRAEMDSSGDAVRGENRWPMAVTLIVAMALPFLLLAKYAFGPQWIVPVIEAGLLVALVIADPGRIDRRSTVVRVLSIGLIVILVAGASAATVRLVIDLIRGGSGTVIVGQYASDPEGKLTDGSGQYLSVTANSDPFSAVSTLDCRLRGGNTIEWWDPTTNSWKAASDQSYNPLSKCVAMYVTPTTTPDLIDLSGAAVLDKNTSMTCPY